MLNVGTNFTIKPNCDTLHKSPIYGIIQIWWGESTANKNKMVPQQKQYEWKTIGIIKWIEPKQKNLHDTHPLSQMYTILNWTQLGETG